MKWSRDKSKSKSKDSDNGDTQSWALVKQDPRTKVKTTSAQSETTNTTTQNATIFNSNAKTVTYQSTKQTVTSRQTARITEITTRRTPTPQELEEMMRLLHMNKKAETKTFTTTSTTSGVQLRRNRPANLPALPSSSSSSTSRNSINSLNNKSTPKFKSTASPVSRLIFNFNESSPGSTTGDSCKSPITPTLVKTQTTTFSEKNGRTITQKVEEHRIKLDPKSFKISTPNSPLSRNFMGEDNMKFSSTDARPIITLPALPAPKSATTTTTISSKTFNLQPANTTISSTYTSPYSQRQLTSGSTASNLAFKPSTSKTNQTTKPISTIKNTTTTSSTTKPGSIFSSWSTPTSKPFTTTTSSAASTSKPSSIYSSWSTSTSKPSNTNSSTSASSAKPGSVFSSWGTTTSKPSTTTNSTSSNINSNSKPGSLFSSWSSPSAKPATTATTTNLDARPFPRTTAAVASSSVLTNTKPTGTKPNEVLRYKPGYAYVFNNVIFDNPNNEERIGSAEDVKALVQTFEHFKMKVTVIDNAKVDKIRKTVDKSK